MSSLTKQIQLEAQRGVILRVLIDWQLEWIPFNELRLHVMRRTGHPLCRPRAAVPSELSLAGRLR